MQALQDDGRGARRWSAHTGEAIICSHGANVKVVTHGRGHTHGWRRDGCYHRAMASQQSGDRMPTVDLELLTELIERQAPGAGTRRSARGRGHLAGACQAGGRVTQAAHGRHH